MTILTIGVVVLALALTLVLAAATSVHLQRTRLAALADLAALDAADGIDDPSYFRPGADAPGRPVVPLTDAGVSAGVERYLAEHAEPGLDQLDVVEASTDGGSVHVVLTAVAHPTLLGPWLASWVPDVRVEATSSARAW
ncbi:pilus assembly protein TadG-related protein [Cellulomonas citrea]|uniref:pilus assembly protein TadG-related protein n=1 Tax=Cellulomonas citrea TaxID=1909423 RepID=UPI001F1D8B61|nr:pilus assembly protein TadG-related protein [Cellulomonas citrea]